MKFKSKMKRNETEQNVETENQKKKKDNELKDEIVSHEFNNNNWFWCNKRTLVQTQAERNSFSCLSKLRH